MDILPKQQVSLDRSKLPAESDRKNKIKKWK
jgi:hypothetical protein